MAHERCWSAFSPGKVPPHTCWCGYVALCCVWFRSAGEASRLGLEISFLLVTLLYRQSHHDLSVSVSVSFSSVYRSGVCGGDDGHLLRGRANHVRGRASKVPKGRRLRARIFLSCCERRGRRVGVTTLPSYYVTSFNTTVVLPFVLFPCVDVS